MSVLKAVRVYSSLFGAYGVVLATKARLLGQAIEVIVESPGTKYPIHVRLTTTDISTLWQVLVMEEYDLAIAQCPQVIVDAGANIGLTSVYYANKYPTAKIIAIEPEPTNYQVLERNVEPYPNVTPLRKALWKQNEELNLIDPGSGHHRFETHNKSEPDCGCIRGSVSGITLDALLKLYDLSHIDILKIDIEGSEKEVFESSSPWIDRVGIIAVEVHDRFKVGCRRAVHVATEGFQVVCQRGEVVFLVRGEHLAGKRQGGSAICSVDAEQYQPRIKLPLRILRAM